MTEQYEDIGSLLPVENPNLVFKITAILSESGHKRPADWESRVHPDALHVHDEKIQRFLINRYWRETIGALAQETMDIRYCLVEQGSLEDWLRLFRTGVAPCIVENHLPEAIH